MAEHAASMAVYNACEDPTFNHMCHIRAYTEQCVGTAACAQLEPLHATRTSAFLILMLLGLLVGSRCHAVCKIQQLHHTQARALEQHGAAAVSSQQLAQPTPEERTEPDRLQQTWVCTGG